MDEIKATVDEIVAQCKGHGATVSEALAAFVARTVVTENSSQFRMDKDMTDADIRDLVRMCVQRILQKDSPSLETIKMQVGFDTAYVQNEERLEKARTTKENQLKEMKRAICEVKPKSGSDFESLTALYRQIFTYLLKHADADTAGDRTVEREIAAALESVFPRIGLRSFISMPSAEKINQLTELANIVHGIRLFNREIGKGGAGIDDTVNLAVAEVTALFHKLQSEVEALSEDCQQYTDVLIHAHHFKPENVSAEMAERWQQELTNRRQYLSYCQSLQEDVMLSAQKTESHKDNFMQEMTDLKALVGSKASVPKETVYPKFDKLAELWLMLAAERLLVAVRESTRRTLVQFKASFNATLSGEFIAQVQSTGLPSPEQESQMAANIEHTSFETGLEDEGGGRTGGGGGGGAGGASHIGHQLGEGADEEVPVRLSIESTPEFMQLPLEYQGYCPWTIVRRKGLLLPGNPALGVVRYRNSFNVFVHEEALRAFMQDPRGYTSGVHTVARRCPELIHLLRLQEHFPNASLARLLGTGGGGGGARGEGVHPLLGPAPAQMVDAATETPVHFIEKNIDPNYDWNEWSLRRKALKLAQLRKGRTVSTQTDLSHYRRDGETQHYAPREHGTQTATERGTNPFRSKNYLAGVCGGPATNGTMYAASDPANPDQPVSQVNLTYES
jgi:hypothetical protein